MVVRLTALLGISLLFAGCTGCIEFDKQTMVFRHYPKTDTLVIWQQYEGIHGKGEGDELSDEEIEQLESVLQGQRTFFFANWIYEYDGKAVKQYIQELKEELKEDAADKDPAQLRSLIASLELLQKSIDIYNVSFHLNKQGQLSATQQVTLRNVSKHIKAANAFLRSLIVIGELDADDELTKLLLDKSVEDEMEYISLVGQRLRVQWPMSAKQFMQLDLDEDAMKKFTQTGGTVKHANGFLWVEVGKVQSADTTVSIRLSDAEFENNAAEHVAKRFGIDRKFDPAKARAAFFRECDQQFAK